MRLIPVHVGLFGHIDHGKTAIARILSEKISTAGLDKHPQAQERGISIDLGFTAFNLDPYRVTLVDAPGHADLIRSVVAGANIIDAAMLVIAADEGPKPQTGEHILILDSFSISKALIIINKIDLVEKSRVNAVERSIKALLKGTILENSPIVGVSAKTGEGTKSIKEALLELLKKPVREVKGPFKMPIDHAFHIKGAGTVMTGTVHRGTINIGEVAEIMPLEIQGKIKSIQTFGENLQSAVAGDRVGIAIPGVQARVIYRGCYLCSPGSLSSTDTILARLKVNKFFKFNLSPRMNVHLTIGTPTVAGVIYPFQKDDDYNVVLDQVSANHEFFAYVILNSLIVSESGDPILISRLDLPPTNLRIAASGKVINANPSDFSLYQLSIKEGNIRIQSHKEEVIIDNLARSQFGAKNLIGKQVETITGRSGRIISSFGGKGAVIAKFSERPNESAIVYLKKYKRYKLGT
ncbi:selenocysteine-specific translation elongation factor [Candidatus Borrarchaeum sp.]|uniref:selenocysteine-specific translation elongation factor n=1 Tax=Candidatus Borrarchaeum sp. TaxID=2846742 RepID=UPI00257D5263|nr:selenocysteine-specific translation elongation factor [Candidatus Borrarchaeum sp.]